MRTSFFVAFVLLSTLTASQCVSAEPSCKDSPALVGRCFTVHARLAIYNGSCVERLWPAGTKRLLALARPDGACDPDLPPSIMKLLDRGPPSSMAVFGDYEVCPTTRARPGAMQHVCLAGASHLMARRVN